MQFSVIIPVYNREHLIEGALESVFDQTFDDYEVIVVDDGSTDRTVDVVEDYPESVRLIRQDNSGPGVARNTGIEAAHGEYVVFLDSDDRWFPWTLETIHLAIDEYGNPAFVTGPSVDFEATPTSEDPESNEMELHPDYYSTSDNNVQIFGCSCAIRREMVQAVGGFSGYRINGEDSDLWMRLGTASGFVHILSPPVHAYRWHDESAVSNLWRSYLGGVCMIKNEKKGGYPGGAPRRLERLQIITRHLRPKALRLLRAKEYKKGFLIYKHTFSWNWTLRRFRFLFGFPLMAVSHWIKRHVPFTSQSVQG